MTRSAKVKASLTIGLCAAVMLSSGAQLTGEQTNAFLPCPAISAGKNSSKKSEQLTVIDASFGKIKLSLKIGELISELFD